MKRILDRLFVGDLADCQDSKATLGWSAKGGAIVHACKHPCHSGHCGKVKAGAPDYLAARSEDGRELFLNLIDPPTPLLQPESFTLFLAFMAEQWKAGREILIHCNQGQSRAPSLALLFAAKCLGAIPSETFDEAWDAFEALAGDYSPGAGIETYLRANWQKITGERLPWMDGASTAPVQQVAEPTLEQPWIDLSPEEAVAAIKTSPFVHFTTSCRITDKDGVLTPPDQHIVPNVFQGRALEAYEWCVANEQPIRLVLGPKPRQSGGSTVSAELCLHHTKRFKTGGMVLADENDRTDLVWQMFNKMAEIDRFPDIWNVKHRWNTERAVFIYTNEEGEEIELEWLRDTANDPKAGASGTRRCLWFSEAGRYSKEGKVTDTQVISNASSSVPEKPGTMIILESTAEGACYDGETELLTDKGWKFFRDLDGSERILTKDRKTGVAYYQDTWAPVGFRWKGDMIRFKTRTTDLRVTPNHMMWAARQKGPMRLQSAESMTKTVTDFYMDRGMKWEAEGLTEFVLPSYTHRQSRGMRTIPEKRIPIDVWLRFLGYWLSDGHVTFIYGNKGVSLTQVKFPEHFRIAAQELASAIGADLRDVPHGNGRRFTLCSAQLARYLKDYSKPKRIPRELLMNLSRQQCRLLIEAIYLGDGDQEHRSAKSRPRRTIDYGKIYAGIDETLVDDIQELALKAGYATSAYGPERNRVVTFTESTRSCVRHSNPPTIEKDCEEDVFCVSLPKDHLLMVRRGGIAVWCGNSGYFYNTVKGAVTLEERIQGRVGNGWIKVSCWWHECPDYILPRTLLNEEWFDGKLDDDEKAGVELYNWTAEQIAWRRKKIRSSFNGNVRLFNQEFPACEAEAFQSSGNPRFDTKGITRLEAMAKLRHDFAETGILEDNNGALTFNTKAEVPWLWCIEQPMYGAKYILAMDCMTGVQSAGSQKRDTHACAVWRAGYLDKATGILHGPRLVAAIHLPDGCRWDEDVIAHRAHLLSKFYGNCLMAVEVNEALGVIRCLIDLKANLWHRTKADEASGIVGQQLKIPGWKTTSGASGTRSMIIAELAKFIREQEGVVEYLPFVQQARVFVVNPDGSCSAKTGEHDDWILSGAIAITLMDAATERTPPPAISPSAHRPIPPGIAGKGSGALS